MRAVDFQAPASNRDTGEGLKYISVQVSPNPTGLSGEDFQQAMATALIREYSGVLLGWPYTIAVDGREGVEAKYERIAFFGTAKVTITGWEAVFLVNDQQWAIELVGRSEYRGELEGIHSEFVSRFCLSAGQ